jgi:uncharacterized protein (TIGR02596 family)
VKNASRSFSLLEMLLVLALIATLTVLVMDGYSTTVQALAVTTSADILSDALAEGRTSAVTQNTQVEVRIYELPPQPGAAPVYDAIQLHWLKADGTTPAINPVVFLSSWVAIDATAAHSTLIASNAETAKPDASDARLDGNTRVFHFLPDGSTDLNPTTNWFMTVRPAAQSDPAHFPANWACVQIDPTTGRPQIYRP